MVSFGKPETDAAYVAILAALDSIDWKRAKALGVTKIRPTGIHTELNFVPGQRGFIGERFPIGGVMLVANNFDNLDGWLEYEAEPDFHDSSQTWQRLTNVLLPNSGISITDCWFTNYALGVMNKGNNRYEFPTRILDELGMAPVFDDCVAIMKPRLVVALGEPASRYLGADYNRRRDERVVTFGGHRTRLIGAVHPSAWTWGPGCSNGFGQAEFAAEGRRIGAASRKPLDRPSDASYRSAAGLAAASFGRS